MLISERVALWRANSERCLYCGEAIAFRDLEIDHVIPDSTAPNALQSLKEKLGLDAAFALDSTRNLVPTHHDCNRKKRATQFTENSLRYYLEIWNEKQDAILREREKFESNAGRDDLLARLTYQIEMGTLSKDQIHALLRSLPTSQITPERLPTVLSFSTECENLKTTQELEQQLLAHFRQTFRRPVVRAEASQFNGESLSIRLATWDFDVDKLEGWSLSPWELLEIEAASTVYGSEGAVALASAIEDTYNIFYAERHGCPECGGEVVMSGFAGDTGEFGLATCTACGWEDYHP